MPQLSPLSWIFLFFIFWVMILMVIVLIWWISKSEFNLNISDVNCYNIENNWKW
uniref:ATP synthase F0 subunit 8 n=1 Tax=Cipangopaludina ussuriensis TaxID=2023715 RepID=A0A222YVK9_CIPUS|nr:ATP synthase F0 subunit 8 [Cipangopaludina ussuriensis]ASR74858.1 ATP synthase F0 subunit 8 [Cipangopaludina ussuriensis]